MARRCQFCRFGNLERPPGDALEIRSMASVVTLKRHRAHNETGGRQPDVGIGLHKQGGGGVTHPVRRDGLGQARIGDADCDSLPDSLDALVVVDLDVVAMAAPHGGTRKRRRRMPAQRRCSTQVGSLRPIDAQVTVAPPGTGKKPTHTARGEKLGFLGR